MKKVAGIFDPWRQAAAPPVDETPARKTPTDFSVRGDSDKAPEMHCVQFNGIRAGLFIWVQDDGEDGSPRARSAVIGVVHRISSREGVLNILNGWGVYVGTPKQPNPIVLADGEKKITISVPVADDRLVPRAIDNLSLALREVSQQFPDVRDMLVALQIRPYVK